MRIRLFSRLLAALLCVFTVGRGIAGDGLWPIQKLPEEQLKKDLDFAPDAEWTQRIQRACVKITPRGIPAGGSGAFVSANGLVLTNHHVVRDSLLRASKPGDDLLHEGIVASSHGAELDCGLQIHVLDQVMDVTELVGGQLGQKHSPADFARIQRQLESRSGEGVTFQFVPTFGGARCEMYIYQTYDSKIVFAPEESFADFGGEDDNFCYPRHKLDIAFLRAYRKGAPVKNRDWLPLSAAGVREGDNVFVAGHPATTERYLPVSRMQYLRDHELKLRVALMKPITQALEKYSQTSEQARLAASGPFRHWSNQLKVYEGSLAYLKQPGVLEARQKEEAQWRRDFAALKEKGAEYLRALDEADSACIAMRDDAALRELGQLQSSKLFGLAASVNSVAKAMSGKNADERAEIAESFSGFLNQVFDQSDPIQFDVEQVVMTAWLSAAKEQLPPDDPFIKKALGKDAPADVVARILQKAETLVDYDALAKLIAGGGQAIQDAQIPLLKFISDVDEVVDPKHQSFQDTQNRYDTNIALAARGLAEVYGSKLSPDACGTLRLGWGKVLGYSEGGKRIRWNTTFQSMIDLSNAKGGKGDYALGTSFKSAVGGLDTAVPFNFVSTVDGAPGSSGAPIFTQDGKLVGVLFDGNQQQVPSVYAYIPPETGARSISVHTAAIWAALEKVYKARQLCDELKAAQ